MATFVSDIDLRLRAGSNVDQTDANRALRDRLRSALSAAQGQLQGLAPGGETAPTLAEIASMSTNQMKPWAQRLVREYVRQLALSFDVQAADSTFVKPVRDRAPVFEDVTG